MCFHGLQPVAVDPSLIFKEKNESELMKTGGRGLGGGWRLSLSVKHRSVLGVYISSAAQTGNEKSVEEKTFVSRGSFIAMTTSNRSPGFSLRFLMAALLQDWEESRKWKVLPVTNSVYVC